MQLIGRFLLLFIIFTSSIAFAKNQTVYFEPKTVDIKGTIKSLKFPGSPNYNDIKKGDTVEKGPYLILSQPIDITFAPHLQSINNDPEKNVKIIQLVIDNKHDWGKAKEGNYVQIVGTLFHGFTGHHHTRILLKVKKITVLSTKPVPNLDKLDLTKEDMEFMKQESPQKPLVKY